jgi:hypothetical protein
VPESHQQPLEPSLQIVTHATDGVIQQRVTAILAQQTLAGAATGPTPDPSADVVERRWEWAARWGTIPTVTDGQIRDAVLELWPPADKE